MATVVIKLVEKKRLIEFFLTKNSIELARKMMAEGGYTTCDPIELKGVGTQAADAAYDLTNNPRRLREREQLYCRGRSISIGDIVEVDGVDFLCSNLGWQKVEAAEPTAKSKAAPSLS